MNNKKKKVTENKIIENTNQFGPIIKIGSPFLFPKKQKQFPILLQKNCFDASIDIGPVKSSESTSPIEPDIILSEDEPN
jgi:hypothetical protein